MLGMNTSGLWCISSWKRPSCTFFFFFKPVLLPQLLGAKTPRPSATRWVCGYQQWLKSEPGGYALSERNSITGKWPVIETIPGIPKPTLHQCCSWQNTGFPLLLFTPLGCWCWETAHGRHLIKHFIDGSGCGVRSESPNSSLSRGIIAVSTLFCDIALVYGNAGLGLGACCTWVSAERQVETSLWD